MSKISKRDTLVWMRVVSNKALIEFIVSNHDADGPLRAWRKSIEVARFSNHAELKRAFNSVDRVSGFYVFDIGGNKYRVICAVHFNRQMLFIRHVYTHKEYDKWKP